MIDVKINSKNVKEGDIFIALKGINDDGHKYIEDAIKNGASKIICEYGDYEVTTLKVKNTRKFLIKHLKENYYNNIKNLILIGITGTSGKTTTAFLTYQMLNGLKEKAAYIGTNGFYMNEFIRDLDNTTPDLYEIYEMLLECKKEGIKYVVMEVSSHSLALKRLETLQFDRACFTNLTSEHMNFHKTMKKYFKSKKKLFKKLKNEKICIINEGKYSKKLMRLKNNNILLKKDDFKFIRYYINKTKFKFYFKDKIYKFEIPLVGNYNIWNYLDALLLVHSLGFKISKIKKIKITPPKGRMELIEYKNNSIFIDYAHKPDAVQKVLELANTIKEGKVITIIGCGGNRDKTKRPIMGLLAASGSDYVIFTNDNPRTEDPIDILNDITEDLKYDNFEVIIDREEAIKKGISLLGNKDILLILGKGHEDYQIIGKDKHHFSDKEAVLRNIS